MEYKLSKILEPASIILNLDTYYGNGIKDIKIIIDSKTFFFSKKEIKEFLEWIDRGIPRDN